MPAPRVAAIHDLSGFGRCSLTIVIPALSAMGIQCCPLPTAYLSTHTGGFEGNTFLDMTDQMAPVSAHWQSLGLRFDAIYTGFMGSREQIALSGEFIRAFRREGTIAVVDPVLGDHGRAYRTCTPEMCRGMVELAELADVITPNRTEAALLLGWPYEAVRLDDADLCRHWAGLLSLDRRRSVVLKGVSLEPGRVGAVCLDRETGRADFVSAPLAPGQFHGTGDLFASVLTGALVKGISLPEAARLAADFTALAARRTAEQDIPRREGVDFEPLLGVLGAMTAPEERGGGPR
ncbi:MAG: pyridoxamine kinase [Oscillospiraceae bacterium]|nr:pyridoxamine kinase [Oscillospiraceae bacterium]